MQRDVLIPIFVNPLVAFFADPNWKAMQQDAPTLEAALEYLCDPNVDSSLDAIITRYKEAKDDPRGLFAAPNEPQILEKLVWPLRNAKSSYMLGNYLGTIALCGMVAEMIAILLFEMSDLRFQNGPMTDAAQKALFGSTFEKLGQDRRVAVLHGFGLVNDATKSQFDQIRTIRKRYLHLWSHGHDSLAADAVKCYQAALGVVVTVIGQDIKDDRIVVNPNLVKYLRERGLIQQDGTPEMAEPANTPEPVAGPDSSGESSPPAR